ncbi:EXS-domain-containing protein [Tuber magnatum]|uniref:EXS-domain-containing protein n=1 Tax=Tuber magnatum TaxID=42249 RepID=A0A317SVX5_9PEZI|nr:EXS-domain-containing protein [Tuber magnatum]
MKFAKSLEELMVPEWSSQYIQYKVGKKKVKAITADINHLSSRAPARTGFSRTRERATAYAKDHLHHRWRSSVGQEAPKTPRPASAPHSAASSGIRPPLPHTPRPVTADRRSIPPDDTDSGNTPSRPLRNSMKDDGGLSNSPGSWINTHGALGVRVLTMPAPRSADSYSYTHSDRYTDDLPSVPPDLMLPDPIQPLQPLIELGPEANIPNNPNPPVQPSRPESIELADDPPPPLGSLFSRDPTGGHPLSTITARAFRPLSTSFLRRSVMTSPRPFVNRLSSFFAAPWQTTDSSAIDITEAQLVASAEFQKWLLIELNKIENFYKRREAEAIIRFDEMKEQLGILRLRWLKAHSQTYGDPSGLEFIEERLEDNAVDKQGSAWSSTGTENSSKRIPDLSAHRRIGWKNSLVAMTGLKPPQCSSQEVMGSTIAQRMDACRDYERREPINDPTHRQAKSRLKRAFIEYYRRLELLKSYVCVNKDAFCKITKKFDKASGLRTSPRFFNERINKSYFGGSENKLDDLINETEILFARFFMKSNRKEAALRLRTRENKSVYHASFLRSGFYLGSSLVIGAYGLWQAIHQLNSTSPGVRQKTSYLLQIPSLFITIFAICFWFSVYDFWPDELDMIHFPLIYISLAAAVLFNPIKRFYFRSRKFFLLTIARVLISGFKRVEFKDFWVADMLCSQTYALGNISLFFCLYINRWQNPDNCSSSQSRLMGFFTALPATWRFFQCLRRYRDSGQVFPQLANCGKYACTVLHYVMLSLWRMDHNNTGLRAGFIAIASINSFYTIFWDIVMDWSLLNPYASWPFVRDAVGFKNSWVYYFAMMADPILRFSWVFYVIYANGIPHQALFNFILAALEVIRRFIWCFFRMENEHVGKYTPLSQPLLLWLKLTICFSSVGANRAYRDPRLPYRFPAPEQICLPCPTPEGTATPLLITTSVPTVDVERSAVRRRHRSRRRSGTKTSPAMQALERLGRTMTNAHKKDYERKRSTAESEDEDEDLGVSSDEDDGEDYYERTAGTEGYSPSKTTDLH